jgi:putative glycosyltransferase
MEKFSTASSRPALSIVSTMYRSRQFLDQFLKQCLQSVHDIGCTKFEIVLVNDGSPDDSVDYAISRKHDIPELVIVDLSRNFGHHYAMQAGLRHARGELIMLIDCDLEVSPMILRQFKERMEETGCDMVYGYQELRKGGVFERASGGFFYKAFNLLSDIKIPENIATERLMTRRYVEALMQLGDHNLFMGGMMSWVGFDQIGIPVKKKQREGKSSYTLLRRIHLMVNAISSFSAVPLVWMFNVGMFITAASFGYLFYLLFRKILFNDTMIGFTSMMALMTLSLGILTTGLGIIGIYVGKVFTQVQNRPTYIVKDIYR